jgi:hypothetical protein
MMTPDPIRALLQAEIAALRAALEEVLPYFEDREDADHNGISYVSNDEMQHANTIRAALARTTHPRPMIGETHEPPVFLHDGEPE